jgi:hypothetical protein
MRKLDLSVWTVTCSLAAALSGCSILGVPGATPGTLLQARAAKSQALLYVSSIYGYGAVDVYTFPQGKLVGALDISGQPGAMCTDARGDVFIPEDENNNQGVVAEYAHGGADPITTYGDPDTPYACAVDPTTGNLGVANQNRTFAIFNRTSPSPTLYSNSDVESYYFTSYDAHGNLFVIAYAFASAYELYELTKGSSTLQKVTVPFNICCPLWIQWDGRYLAIDDPKGSGDNDVVYRLSISKYKATIAGKLTLDSGRSYTAQSWIDGKTLIHPDYYAEDVAFWRYPGGGKAWKTFKDAGTYIMGVTVSNGSTAQR